MQRTLSIATVALSGFSVESRLGLRSTYFKVRRAGLHAPSHIKRGHSVQLEGSIWPRFADQVTILHRQLGASFVRVYTVPVHADGSFHHAIHPKHTSDYRLATAHADSPTIRVRVN